LRRKPRSTNVPYGGGPRQFGQQMRDDGIPTEVQLGELRRYRARHVQRLLRGDLTWLDREIKQLARLHGEAGKGQ